MLRIARHTDYAARIVAHLASIEPNATVRIAEIAASRRLPVPFVRRIVMRLAEAKIVETVRGNKGGVRLARLATDISLLDVVRAMEGPIYLNDCLEGSHTCPFSKNCPVQRAWAEAANALEHALAKTRFDGLGGVPGHIDAHRRLGPRLKS